MSTPALVVTPVQPARAFQSEPGTLFIDFGKTWFGTLRFKAAAAAPSTMTVRMGEKCVENNVDTQPGAEIRAKEFSVDLRPGTHEYTLTIPAVARHSHPYAVQNPPGHSEVTPFRYAEFSLPPGVEISAPLLLARHAAIPDTARFRCSDPLLAEIWELCRHSVVATSFLGVYVDGDRERIPYEADAYINMLAHFAIDTNPAIARATFERLIQKPTWPTEWQLHMPLIAWADYLHTGDAEFYAPFFDRLRARCLEALRNPAGLLDTSKEFQTPEVLASINRTEPVRDIVDWPPSDFYGHQLLGERDGFEFGAVNTGVQAFHVAALEKLAKLGKALGRESEANALLAEAVSTRESLRGAAFDSIRGLFRDGPHTSHTSLHATLFPLVFDLLSSDDVLSAIAFIRERGMACSPYGAHFLLEGLFRAREPRLALELITSRGPRSWHNMLAQGATITWEAWDRQYKPNLDWNHAWGAAPGYLLPAYVAGIRPGAPGFREVLIDPQPGDLEWIECTRPVPGGVVSIRYEQTDGRWKLEVQGPDAVPMRVPGEENAIRSGRFQLEGQMNR